MSFIAVSSATHILQRDEGRARRKGRSGGGARGERWVEGPAGGREAGGESRWSEGRAGRARVMICREMVAASWMSEGYAGDRDHATYYLWTGQGLAVVLGRGGERE